MMKAISDNILELSVVALVAFVIWGFGYLILVSNDMTAEKYELCVSQGMQWIAGSCVR